MKIPVSTYRIQFHNGFTFSHARDILAYFKDLGVSHIYSSPVLASRKGSTHGYDVVDPGAIDTELGGFDAFVGLNDMSREIGLGWIQDFVPNHMAFDSANLMLMDVLERGEKSGFYDFFDITWQHPYDNLKGKLLVPFLGEFYGECLEKGEISLTLEGGTFYVKYYDLKIPLFLGTYVDVLSRCLQSGEQRGEAIEKSFLKAVDIFRGLDISDKSAADAAKEKFREIVASDRAVCNKITAFLDNMNSGTKVSLETLHEIISGQIFRLAFWKVGNDELNYRRFFTVNSLICIRTEKAEVFDHLHALLFRLVEQGRIDGIRLDHIDGLESPPVYLRRLRERVPDTYIVAEKILCDKEEMPEGWPIQGTTGYDFLNYLNGIFVDTSSEKAMDRVYRYFKPVREDFNDMVVQKKRIFMGKHMAGDIDNLAHQLKNIINVRRDGSDFTMYGLRRALVEVMAHFPVYRTYISELGISGSDEFYIKQAIEKSRRCENALIREFDYLEKVLLACPEIKAGEHEKELMRDFAKRFQQISGPLMAKGAEDTAFYIYNRLVSLNEVGGMPERFGIDMESFHEFNVKRARDWPDSLNATSTHDTKRGEDLRARINFLSEIPVEWDRKVRSWQKMNRRKKVRAGSMMAPSGNEEYLLYQTLVGAFPFSNADLKGFRERIKEYFVKALREAKVNTGWIEPDEPYERACAVFVDSILEERGDNLFLTELRSFHEKVSRFGVYNSLSQTLLKLTCPGVPDIYQGTELWDLSLVDPDNRRPVDFNLRKAILRGIISEEHRIPDLASEILKSPEDGRIKLFTIYRGLKTRRLFPELFREGDYTPLKVTGKYNRNVAAFSREKGRDMCVVIVPRLLSRVINEHEMPLGRTVWEDTAVEFPGLSRGEWVDMLTGKEIRVEGGLNVGDIMDIFPAVLMVPGKAR